MQDKPMRRGWMLATGLVLVMVGLSFLLVPLLATFAAGVAAGALLLTAGLAQVVEAATDRERAWAWAFAMGLLGAVAGLMLLLDPIDAMVGVTLLLAGYLLAVGALKVVQAALWSPVPGWGWLLFNGGISMLLGLLILTGWPGTGLWTIGVFLGVDLLLAGFSRVVRSVSLPELAGPDDRMIPTPRA